MTALWGLWLWLVGACWGSFIGVCMSRWPRGLSIRTPRRSQCDICNKPIIFYDLMPVFSFLWLRGKTRCCGARLSIQYPLLEMSMGLFAYVLWYRLFPEYTWDWTAVAYWACWLTIIGGMLIAAYVDVRYRIIPDEVSIYPIPAVIGMHAFWSWFRPDFPAVISWKMSTLGAGIGGLSFALIAILAHQLMRREGLGWGDVKFIALIGACFGPLPGLWFVCFLSALLGAIAGIVFLIFQKRRMILPYGPWIVLAALIYLFYGQPMIQAFFPSMDMASLITSF